MKSMVRLFEVIIAFTLIGAVATTYQNCTDQGSVEFNSEQNRLAANENGTPFLGKPEEGDYKRTYQQSPCTSNSSTEIGLLTVDTSNLALKLDVCDPINYVLSLNSQNITYSNYNSEYFGLGEAIFEKIKPNSNDLPVTEVWCRGPQGLSAIDAVVKVNSDLTQASAKLYLGDRRQTSDPWTGSMVNSFSVQRNLTQQMVYISPSFSLVVPQPPTGKYQTTGHLIATVNDQIYDTDVDCRIAFDKPIVPLLSSVVILNNSQLTSDGGFAWFMRINSGGLADTLNAANQSTLLLYEDGRLMGPRHVLHVDIRNLGLGRYSHWGNVDGTGEAIRFAASDNTDPRTNGRVYSYIVSSPAP